MVALIIKRLMVSVSLVYFSLFTVTNIYLNFYLHKTAEVYRKAKRLPTWASNTRNFFENTDGVIKPCEIDNILSTMSDVVDTEKEKKFNKSVFGQAGHLEFLQLNTTPDNKFDLRDDFEFRQSLKKNTQNPVEMKLNDYRLNLIHANNQNQDNGLDDLVEQVMEEVEVKDENLNNNGNETAEAMTDESFTRKYGEYIQRDPDPMENIELEPAQYDGY